MLIKIQNVALNSRDINILQSTYPLPVKDNIIPCSDICGTVIELGSSIFNFVIGDMVINCLNPAFLYGTLQNEYGREMYRAMRDGVLREYIALPVHAVVKIPKSE
jgi:NADPH:quinone reductase-like Zn-dependent oxidoreductase